MQCVFARIVAILGLVHVTLVPGPVTTVQGGHQMLSSAFDFPFELSLNSNPDPNPNPNPNPTPLLASLGIIA